MTTSSDSSNIGFEEDIINNINPRYLGAINRFSKEEIENANKAADYWYYIEGANVIPVDAKQKKAWILKSWTWCQSNSIPLKVFEKLKELGLFAYGVGVVLGRLWRGDNTGKFLNMIDGDNRLALQEICTRNGRIVSIQELGQWTLIEQHKDDSDRGHIYIASEKPFPFKASDKGKPGLGNRIATNEIPAIEVKCIGYIAYAWNSMHQNGCRYEFVNGEPSLGLGLGLDGNKRKAALCDAFKEHINNICKKYGLQYLDESGKSGVGDIPIAELFEEDTIIYEGNDRHRELLRASTSLIRRNRSILPLEKIKRFAVEWNQIHCNRPLSDREVNRIFNQATKKVSSGKEKGKGREKKSKYKTKSNGNDNNSAPPEEEGVQLDEEAIQEICSMITSFSGQEGPVYKIFGFFRKHEISLASCISIIQTLTNNEEERRYRISVLEQIYNNTYEDTQDVTSKHLLDVLTSLTGVVKAKKILARIIDLLIRSSEQDPVEWLADSIMKEHVFVAMGDNDNIYYYEKGIFVDGGIIIIKKLIQLLHPNITTHDVNEILNQIRRSTYVSRSDFDKNIDVINTETCALNIHTLEVKPHSPDYLSLVKIPVTYNPEAKCPLTLAFFDEVLSPEYIPVIRQMFGYCLYKTWKYQKSFMLFGRAGSNGKGVIISLVEALLGNSNCSHRSLQDLDTNRFAIADLYGKYANTFGDLKSTKLSETGNFKVMAAGDAVTGEHKFGQPFTFRNQSKMIFSANLIPESEDKTDAFYRRWVIIPFDKRWIDGNEDAELTGKLTTPEELSGLLNWALVGLKELIKNGGFHNKTIEQVKKEYEENTSDVNTFLIQECIIDTQQEEYRTLTTDLQAAYVNFCKSRHVIPFEMSVFGRELAKHGIHNEQYRENGERDRYYVGVILRSSLRKSDQTML
jgi:P4 family phage/plasmid primase-like protien